MNTKQQLWSASFTGQPLRGAHHGPDDPVFAAETGRPSGCGALGFMAPARARLFRLAALILLSAGILSAQPGSLIWSASTDWKVLASAAGGDVDLDGFPDVFAGSGDGLTYCYSGGGPSRGSILWSWNFGADIRAVSALSDVTGDGISECLTGGANDQVSCMSGRPEEGSTSVVWSYAIPGDVWSIATVEDLDNDGYDDCLTGGADDKVTCLSGKWGSLLWSYQDAASGSVKTVAPIGDVNGDGKADCLAGGENDKVVCVSGGSAGTGTALWSVKTGSTVLSVTGTSDFTGDGIPDCFAGGEDDHVYGISGTGARRWSYPAGATVRRVAVIADVNGDGKPDCLAASEDNKAYCLSGADGGLLWAFTTGSSVVALSSIRDVNGDGVEDCIAGGMDDKVYCLDGKTGGLVWSYSTGGTVTCVSALSDISGNGSPDVLAGSDDSYVYAIEGGIDEESTGTPNAPSGLSTGAVGLAVAFTAGGAVSSLGHAVVYRFDWGDGTLSGWGSSSQSHVFNAANTFQVRAQARCDVHATVMSGWSSAAVIRIASTGVEAIATGTIPSDFSLSANYPNPFNGTTAFTAGLPRSCRARAEVFDVQGNPIAVLMDQTLAAGLQRIVWNGMDSAGRPVPSGVYLCRLTADEYRAVRMMMYLK